MPEPAAAAQTLLGFDVGLRRTGVAVGTTLLREARALTTLDAEGAARFGPIAALIAEWQPAALVVGVPFHPDGQPHAMTEQARRFARQLAGRFGLPVHEVDERYTSVEAESRLAAQGRRAPPGCRDPRLDAEAAALILAQHLDGLP